MRRKTALLLWAAGSLFGETGRAADTVVLDNGVMRMVINRQGGAVSSCTLSGSELNPFSWQAKRWPGNPSVKEGLFICFDRLGKPSEADLERGIPFHGEATGVRWKVLEQGADASGDRLLRMQCRLPVAGMALLREYRLFKDSSVCRITDRIRNENTFSKSYNLLHHPSLAAPFLDASVIIDCNAARGFMNTKTLSEIPGPALDWPGIEYQGKRIDLRRMTDGEGLVANYVCAEGVEHGWGGVANPAKGLLAGCLWPTADYPWLRVWREWDAGEPRALGVEFGTTPLGIPLEEVEQVGKLLGHPVIERLAAGAETVKHFYLFLAAVPEDFAGIARVSLEQDALAIEERGTDGPRRWTLPCRREQAASP